MDSRLSFIIFKLHGDEVVERRVPPNRIVEALQKSKEVGASNVPGGVPSRGAPPTRLSLLATLISTPRVWAASTPTSRYTPTN